MFQRWVGGKAARVLSWWCFNPGIAMEEFAKLGVRSVILTSGTLSPLDSFAFELNLWGFNYSIMPFFVCNCVTLSCASFRVKGLLVFSHSPSRQKISRRVTNCCYVIVGLARRLTFCKYMCFVVNTHIQDLWASALTFYVEKKQTIWCAAGESPCHWCQPDLGGCCLHGPLWTTPQFFIPNSWFHWVQAWAWQYNWYTCDKRNTFRELWWRILATFEHEKQLSLE